MKKSLMVYIISIASLAPAMDINEPAQSPTQITQSQFPIIQELPPEILQPILYDAIVQAPTLDQAVKNFAQSTGATRQTVAFRHDPQFNGMIIQALKERFPQESLEDIVIKMNTKEALDWYFKKHPEAKTDNVKLLELFDKAVRLGRYQAFIELTSLTSLKPATLERYIISMDSPWLFNWYLTKNPETLKEEKLKRLLHHAADKNSPQIIKEIVLAKHIPVDSTVASTTPLMVAVNSGSLKAATQLLELDANPNQATKDQLSTPLHLVVSNRSNNPDEEITAVIQLLLAKGANVNQPDLEKMTPLHFARNTSIIDKLITAGANINAQNEYGRTPIARIVQTAKSIDPVSRLLQEPNLDLELEDKYGETALMAAFTSASNPSLTENIIKALIERGANVNAQNNEGKTVLDIAIERNQYGQYGITDTMVQILKDAGALTSAELAAQQSSAAAARPR